jgi:hypothetical protein
MIPTIGVLVAIYAIARLIQAPLALYVPGSARWIVGAIVSALAIIGIAICAVDLLMTGLRSSTALPTIR